MLILNQGRKALNYMVFNGPSLGDVACYAVATGGPEIAAFGRKACSSLAVHEHPGSEPRRPCAPGLRLKEQLPLQLRCRMARALRVSLRKRDEPAPNALAGKRDVSLPPPSIGRSASHGHTLGDEIRITSCLCRNTEI